MLSFIGMIIAGAVLGALARLVMRGEQNISILWTIVLGAVGALVGGAVASLFGVAHTDGIDWIRWALSLAGGEDHALAATFPAEVELPQGWLRIGTVTAGAEVIVDGMPWTGSVGWDHFA